MSIPSNEEISLLLDKLNSFVADDLETQWLEFKPWNVPKSDMRIAIECAACFANTDGGVILFGVADRVLGRSSAIHGVKGYSLDVWRRGIYSGITPNLNVVVEELTVPEGTGKLLMVRVPKGTNIPYGTTQGIFKKRVGKNCMPLDPQNFIKTQISTAAIDWSGAPAQNITMADLDTLEISRARSFLRREAPDSHLLKLKDEEFLNGLEAVRNGQVTNTGLLLFGKPEVIAAACPQSQVHYVHQTSATHVARNDVFRGSLLQTLENIERIFTSPVNPEEELEMGLLRLRIPAFPLLAVREALLNAITHRDYTEPHEVLIRQTPGELVITSPGSFIGGITPQNILRHEPIARNRTLANAFMKLRLVETAGIGRQRIFTTLLSYGKRVPQYKGDGNQVTLRIFDGTFDRAMALLIAKWNGEGRSIDLDSLLILNYLKENTFIDAAGASHLLQMDRDSARTALDQMSQPGAGILERKGHTKSATFHLTKGVAKDLFGKAAYTRTRGINPARYAELVREHVVNHGTITNKECRELLGLGDSPSAQVEASRYLKRWSNPEGFLMPEGKPPKRLYRLRQRS